jgi:hypothetical protein
MGNARSKTTGRKLRIRKTTLRITVTCDDPRVTALVARLIANEIEPLVHTMRAPAMDKDAPVLPAHVKLLYRPAVIVIGELP